MKFYGSVIREIRESKQVTLDMLADEEISKSMLSKFERNQADISLSRFIHLISKLHVSFSEFMLIANEYELDEFKKLISDVTGAYQNESVLILNRLMQDQQELWKRTGTTQYKLNYIMIQALKNDLTGGENLEEDINYLTNFFFNSENWGNYELVLYGNTMSMLPYEQIVILSKELVKKTFIFKHAESNLALIINLLINTILLCLEQRNLKNGLYFLTHLKNEKIPENFFLERVILLYVEGLYEHLKNEGTKTNEGFKKVQYSLDIMESIGAITYRIKFEGFLKNFL
ncbi:helix-turn-helix domain-containing protein [Paucisalibacillus globulus]|uniref:helix-turn-helix domain-containing protein n=1 Tax=Paucisalibacillus globulus TaxID=351095 RepID=UPI00040ECE62|nr:Rgg/GadR/MutR family transcriptional regulator [Paucisalibacillus globulus]